MALFLVVSMIIMYFAMQPNRKVWAMIRDALWKDFVLYIFRSDLFFLGFVASGLMKDDLFGDYMKEWGFK